MNIGSFVLGLSLAASAVECLGFVRGAMDHAVKLAMHVPTSA